MIKEHLEFFSLDLSSGWQVPEGYPEGIEQKILAGSLDETNKKVIWLITFTSSIQVSGFSNRSRPTVSESLMK